MQQVFWPTDLVKAASELRGSGALVLATKLDIGSVVVLNVIPGDKETFVSLGILNRRGALNKTRSDASIVGQFGHVVPTNGLTTFEFINGKITSPTASIILFEPPLPNSMHFFTVSPISIFLTHMPEETPNPTVTTDLMQLDSRELDPQEEHLSNSIDALNKCWHTRTQLMADFPAMHKSWETPSLISNLTERIHEGWRQLTTLYFALFLKPTTTLLIYITIGLRHLCLSIITLLNTRPSPAMPSLIELSATAQQIDLRLQQFCYFPIQYIRTTRLLESEMIPPKQQYPEYIRFYNTLWLIVNDFTMGIVVGGLLIENQRALVTWFDQFVVQRVLYSELNKISVWLMNSPGGIKLNNELSMFLSDLFRWILEFWRVFLINPIAPHYETIIRVISLSSVFGATFSIALFSDFLSVITFHIYCFYIASAKIYNWQLSVLHSLFRLFCGKKNNILRNRVDSNDYEVDQLLLGTLLFTVNLFLLPTVLAFYVMFSITELIIMVVTGGLEVLMSLLNHFPLFILLLKVKDPNRIPGGIKFGLDKGMVRVYMKPLGISEMFAPFTNVLNKMKQSYLSSTTLKGKFSGHTVKVQRNKLYKLLYSALPSTRMSTKQLLQEIQKVL